MLRQKWDTKVIKPLQRWITQVAQISIYLNSNVSLANSIWPKNKAARVLWTWTANTVLKIIKVAIWLRNSTTIWDMIFRDAILTNSNSNITVELITTQSKALPTFLAMVHFSNSPQHPQVAAPPRWSSLDDKTWVLVARASGLWAIITRAPWLCLNSSTSIKLVARVMERATGSHMTN